MTTTLRPSGPLRQGADGARSRGYDVCVNSRRVGAVEVRTSPDFGAAIGEIGDLRIDERDRRRGRGAVAALAAEEVLRGWGCRQVRISVPAASPHAQRLAVSLGYVERSRNMVKELGAAPPLPPDVEVRRMAAGEYEEWAARSQQEFARSWVERGVPEAQARAKAEASMRENLPLGLDTPDTDISVALHEGALAGYLWTGVRDLEPGRRGGFVYDIEVTEALRGRGFGRTLMLLAEHRALRAGTDRLGLHVFAGNAPALGLYASLGYATTHVNSFKTLI
ncbi:GNAT family N-acetyltransferase [Streptomyces sp. NPDC001941]|uniref:GNAT family N-acetyltransferase n=1 Tax=Streptomyces sp. NPDC001941 TaxID=3154659 RepID=UPI0033288369